MSEIGVSDGSVSVSVGNGAKVEIRSVVDILSNKPKSLEEYLGSSKQRISRSERCCVVVAKSEQCSQNQRVLSLQSRAQTFEVKSRVVQLRKTLRPHPKDFVPIAFGIRLERYLIG